MKVNEPAQKGRVPDGRRSMQRCNILTYSTLKSKTLDSSGSQAEKTFVSASTVPHGGGAAREMWSG